MGTIPNPRGHFHTIVRSEICPEPISSKWCIAPVSICVAIVVVLGWFRASRSSQIGCGSNRALLRAANTELKSLVSLKHWSLLHLTTPNKHGQCTEHTLSTHHCSQVRTSATGGGVYLLLLWCHCYRCFVSCCVICWSVCTFRYFFSSLGGIKTL